MPIEVLDSDTSDQRLNQLTQALSSGMFVHVRSMLHDMAASDIAFILESSPPRTRQVLWQLIDQEHTGEILDELGEELKDNLIRQMSPERVAKAAEGMDSTQTFFSKPSWLILCRVYCWRNTSRPS